MTVVRLLLRASRGRFVLAVLLGLLSGASSAVLVSRINQAVTSREPVDQVLVLAFVSAGLASLLTRVGSQVLLNGLHSGALFELRMHLCRRILAAPLRQLEEVGAHRVMTSLVEDANAISAALLHLPTLYVNAAILTGCLVYMAWLSPMLFLAMVGFMAMALLLYWLPTSRTFGLLVRSRQAQDAQYKSFQSLLGGIKELKLHGPRRAAFTDEVLVPASRELRELSTLSANIFSATASWGAFLHVVGLGLLLLVAPRFEGVGWGLVVGYALVVLYLQQPLEGLMSLFPLLGRGAVAMRKMEQMEQGLAAAGAEAGPSGAQVRTFQRLELVGVTHSYTRENEDSRFTLGPLHLHLEPGELVFLVGGNGSGKTTLAKLLTGLYVPEAGEIRIDGEPVTDASRERYRQLFSTVFSDFHLFESLLGFDGSDERVARQVQTSLSRLQLDRKVRVDGGVLSTTALSQGQRKRLALLAALLEDRPLLVFDEWAADQDPGFKDVFYRELLPELRERGKAVLVISHDDRYFPLADRLLRLESGSLVAGGEQPPRARAS
jgi:putative pyoverdin transport system ATP-binding/permease protein